MTENKKRNHNINHEHGKTFRDAWDEEYNLRPIPEPPGLR